MRGSVQELPEGMSSPYAAVLLELAGQVDSYFASVGRHRSAASIKTDIHDLVTEHDKAVQSLVYEFLSESFPTSTFLCEEEGIPRTVEPGCPRWIIDPIDGTSNFASGLPIWALSVAVDIDGEVQAALIHAPLLGETYLADEKDLYRCRLEPGGDGLMPGDWERVLLSPAEHSFLVLSSAPNAGTYARYDGAEAFGRAVKMQVPSSRNFSSAVMELAWTAGGEASAQFNLHTKPWDSAAGLHMVRCSGGDIWVWPPDDDSEFAGEPWYCRGRYLAISGRCRSDNPYACLLKDEISKLIGCEPDIAMLRNDANEEREA